MKPKLIESNEAAPTRSKLVQGLVLLAAVTLCLTVGILGALATTPQIPTWYAGIDKPSWTPPSWLFGPVWTTLYILMGISAWLVWRQAHWSQTRTPLLVFGVQLFLNAIWSPLFFGMHSPLLGLIVIVLLWLMIGATIYCFARVSTLGALLLIPYFIWVSYASCLNFAIWRLNG